MNGSNGVSFSFKGARGILKDFIVVNNFIFTQNVINDIDVQNEIKYLNIKDNKWINIYDSTIQHQSKDNHHLSLIQSLFPKEYKRMSTTTSIQTKKNEIIAHLYIINQKWTENSQTYQENFCKFIINLTSKTLSESIKLPTTINQIYDEIFEIKCVEDKCHVLSYKTNEWFGYSEGTYNPTVCHSIINNQTNKHEILHLINWIYIAGIENRLICNNINKSLYYIQNQMSFNFHKYDSQKNVWNNIKSLHHLRDPSQNIHFCKGDSSTVYIDDNIQIHFDFYSTKIWLQDSNIDTKYIPTGYVLPYKGAYETWISHENEEIELITINGYIREFVNENNNDNENNRIQLPPHYLIQIILKFFHLPQINLILTDLPKNHKDDEVNILKYWKINSSDLLLSSGTYDRRLKTPFQRV